MYIHTHHINQLRDLESEAYFNSVIGTLNRPDPALVALEKIPQQGVLHLRQGYKLTWSFSKEEEGGLTTAHFSNAVISVPHHHCLTSAISVGKE